MARIQVLPLPTVKAGDLERTPFVLVIDQVGDDSYPNEVMYALKEQTGAAAIWAHEGTFDVVSPLELTDEQHAQLLGALTAA